MKDWKLWTLIPALLLLTSIFFIPFENYTIEEWLLGNGIVALGIGCIYIGEGIYKKLKNNGIKRETKNIKR